MRANRSIDVSVAVRDRILGEARGLLAQANQLIHETGTADRVPLAQAQRWRFSAQSMLRRALGERHPVFQDFQHHCSYGLLSRKRFVGAVERFQAGLASVETGTVEAQLSVVCILLEPLAHHVEEQSLDAALWQALAVFSTLTGVRGPGENPSLHSLVERLLKRDLLPPSLAAAFVNESDLRAVANLFLIWLRSQMD